VLVLKVISGERKAFPQIPENGAAFIRKSSFWYCRAPIFESQVPGTQRFNLNACLERVGGPGRVLRLWIICVFWPPELSFETKFTLHPKNTFNAA
jgi:hypothetical protein